MIVTINIRKPTRRHILYGKLCTHIIERDPEHHTFTKLCGKKATHVVDGYPRCPDHK